MGERLLSLRSFSGNMLPSYGPVAQLVRAADS